MLTTHTSTAPGTRHPHDADQAAALLATRLTDAGLASRPHDDGCGHGPHLTILNAAGVRSLLTAGHNGIIRWHYEPRTGPATEPAAITGLALHLLDAPASQPPGDDYRTFLLKGAAGRQLQDQGLTVTCSWTKPGILRRHRTSRSPTRPGPNAAPSASAT